NLLSALSLSKPTISIGCSAKHDVIMAEMGMGEFTQSVRTLDIERLKGQFLELERRAPELRQNLTVANTAKRQLLDEQFDLLFRFLRPRESDLEISVAPHPRPKRPTIVTA